MKQVFLSAFLFVLTCRSFAQDTTHKQVPHKHLADSSRLIHLQAGKFGNIPKSQRKKTEYFIDTIKRERRKFDSTLFTNINVPSNSDYAEDLGKVYQLLNSVPGVTGSFDMLDDIRDELEVADSAIEVIKDRLFQSNHAVNVHSLQMINTLLDALDKNTNSYVHDLNLYDSSLDKVRMDLAALRKDSLMRQIFSDTLLKKEFQPQLQQLKAKWREIDSLVTENGKDINTLRSQASANAITITDLLFHVDTEMAVFASEVFDKESNYLWEPAPLGTSVSGEEFNDSMAVEWQLTQFYFSNTANYRVWLLVAGILFFFWIWRNYRSLKKLNKINALEKFQIRYISPYPLGAALIFVLCLAPFLDLHAPSFYIESVQLTMIIILTVIFFRKAGKHLFVGWVSFLVLFIFLLLLRLTNLPINTQRWLNLLISFISFGGGTYFFWRFRKEFGKWFKSGIILYLLFNVFAAIGNLSGRVTLAQILSFTAVYSFAELVSLGVFVKVIEESFLLQIQTSRIVKKYPESFDYPVIAKGIKRFTIVIAMLLWLIIFTTNLNLFDALSDYLVDLFTGTRQVGNFNFTFGGIFLFGGIIWLANFLQKYIAYFFGDTGDDAAFDDKGQRSRLMVTRLILLIAGFLLAVAASGLAVDRITVILGALGVGIGLGLQSIVNNFVSGVILIFDRPLRIGDTVDIGDKRGRVKEIGIRTSTLLTEEGAEVIIPNGDVLSHNIINWTLSNNHVRETLTFTIDRPANAGDIDVETIKDLVKKNKNVMEEKDPEILISTLNNKSIEVKIFFWCSDFNRSSLTNGEVRAAVYQYFEEKEINVI